MTRPPGQYDPPVWLKPSPEAADHTAASGAPCRTILFRPHIVQWALEHFQRPDPPTNDWFFYQDWVYTQLGYDLVGYTAKRPPNISDFRQSILDASKK